MKISILSREKPVERDGSTTGAVSDLIRLAGDGSLARNAFQPCREHEEHFVSFDLR